MLAIDKIFCFKFRAKKSSIFYCIIELIFFIERFLSKKNVLLKRIIIKKYFCSFYIII